MKRTIVVCVLFCIAGSGAVTAQQGPVPTRNAKLRYAGTVHAEVRIALDLAGVADPNFRNRLNPIYIDPGKAADASLIFQNRSADRTLRVVLSGRQLFDAELMTAHGNQTLWDTRKKAFEDRTGVRLDKCPSPATNGPTVCDIVMTIAPLSPQSLPLTAIAPPQGAAQLENVSVRGASVIGGSGAMLAGDTIVAVDGRPIQGALSVLQAISGASSPDHSVDLLRGGSHVRLRVPSSLAAPDLRDADVPGVRVSHLVPAYGGPLRDGDVLLALRGERLQTITALTRLGAELPSDSPAAAFVAGANTRDISLPSDELLTFVAAQAVAATGAKAVKFTVSFFDDEKDPAYPNGYFAFVTPDKVVEQDSQSALTAAGLFSARLDPFIPNDATGKPVISADVPYSGSVKRHYAATARIGIHQNLGDRADADVDIIYKNGDLGEKAKDATTGTLKEVPGTLTAAKYQFNLYARTGMILSAGRFDLAVPSNKIALNESGEGIRVNVFGNYSVSELIKRESLEGTANPANQDDREWILQGESVTIKGIDFATFSVAALFGKDRSSTTNHSYRTIGGELFFTTPHLHRESEPAPGPVRFRGSAAYYQSRRLAPSTSTIAPGSGKVGLLTATWAFLGPADLKKKKRDSRRSITAIFGMGTGDKAGTPANEGYVGENQAFAPDSVFLASLVKPARAATGQVAPGLANKQYYSVAFSEQQWSLLSYLATIWPFKSQASDIISRSTIIRFNHYGFREPVLGEHDGGNELDIEFLLENPRGIKPAITLARYFPGKAMKPLFGVNPWLVSFAVSIKIGS
jgi:hypothetical protein